MCTHYPRLRNFRNAVCTTVGGCARGRAHARFSETLVVVERNDLQRFLAPIDIRYDDHRGVAGPETCDQTAPNIFLRNGFYPELYICPDVELLIPRIPIHINAHTHNDVSLLLLSASLSQPTPTIISARELAPRAMTQISKR